MRVARPIFILVALLLAPIGWAAETLRYSAVSSWNMPYARFDDDRLVEGIMFDIAAGLEMQLQMPVTFVVLPRKRVDGAALSGDVDLRCYSSPKWTDTPDHYVWSGRLFEVTDTIFGLHTTPPAVNLDAIPNGSIISTVLGYSYPLLDTRFSKGQLRREDAEDQEKLNLKMTAGRTPYGVNETMALNWYQRQTPNHRHAAWRLVISRHDFQCGIPKRGRIAAARILKALEAMKKANQFEDILRKYR